MSRRYEKKTRRSRRKKALKGRGEIEKVEGTDQGTATIQLRVPIAEVLADLGASIEALAGEAGILLMRALIEDEVEGYAGRRYHHDPDRKAMRWGREEGYLVFAGQKVPFARPRVRGVNGKELDLKRYRMFQSDGRLQRAMGGRIIAGVSTRDYDKTLDDFCEGYGIQRSSVSRQWKAITTRKLQELLERPLDELDLAVVLIDGIEFQGNLLVVALGLDAGGRKHILGFVEGATENTGVCDTLLGQLIERGLDPEKRYLFALDGSKALKKSVVKHFGKDAAIQRCIEHKKRNILDHLPTRHHAIVRMKLRAAWNMRSYTEAKAALEAVVRYLRDVNRSAARSLEEALEETLTVHRLRVPELLRKSLRTTNLIESPFATTRKLCGNVKRWRGAQMVQRWAGTMLLEAERRFKRVKGYRAMPILLASLGRVVDEQKAIA